MVESLKRSVDQLEPPSCPNCHTQMQWYRSIRMAESPDWISHYFQCTGCQEVGEVKTKAPATAGGFVPPRKLDGLPLGHEAA